jgi:hypothetical protein
LHPAATKIVFNKLYGPTTALALAKASNSAKYRAAATEAQNRYLAALFFHGFSNEEHWNIKKNIHNDTLTGSDTNPCTNNKVLQLTDQYRSSCQQHQPGSGGGIACAQKGKAAAAATAVTAAMAVTAASSEKKPLHPVPGEKDNKGKMLANISGKKNCFNCSGDDHWVVNCPDLTAAQCNELAGMAHISVGNKEFKGISFLQNESVKPHVVAMRKTLDQPWLYLDSTSSFPQVFTEEHLDNLRLDGATLRADCKAGTNFATKKGWYHDLFDLWLVRKGIADLLCLPQLEADRFTVSYHTGGKWMATTHPGKEITFLREENRYAAYSPTSICSPWTLWPWFKPSAGVMKVSPSAKSRTPLRPTRHMP